MTALLAVNFIGFAVVGAIIWLAVQRHEKREFERADAKDTRDVRARDEILKAVHDMRSLALGAIAQRVDIEKRLGAVEQVLGQHDARLIALESRDEDG